MAADQITRSVAMVFATLVLMSSTQIIITSVNSDQQVPCLFIFGDSLADNGNNNYRVTVARADYMPYGIDFPGRVATGRFNNGPNAVDYLALLLGFSNFIPPFPKATGNTILKGVNYASGGAGIRNETGKLLGLIVSMDEQLNNHAITVSRIENLLVNNSETAQEYLKKCIYHIGIGNNDYLNNYFMPKFYNSSHEYTPEQYAQVLINQYRRQIKRLIDLGGRKVALAGNGLIGCTPYAISTFGRNESGCADSLNIASQLFNNKLVDLVDDLNANYTDAKFIYINNVGIGSGDPTSLGFTVLDKPCCKVTPLGQCDPLLTPCVNRPTYVFWDDFHPTTRVNNFTANRSYIELLQSDTYPLDIKSLAELQL